MIKHPITIMSHLLQRVAMTEAKVLYLIGNKHKFYKVDKVMKDDGTYREITKLRGQLRSLHDSIKIKILDHVEFPEYIHGGVKRKSTLTNAHPHMGCSVLIKMDIKNFYPSIDSKKIQAIFRKKLHFSNKVSFCLANIISVDGVLPQGSPVSTHIANLSLFGEDDLVKHLADEGGVYTRFVDDISISFAECITDEKKTKIISKVSNFIRNNGFKVKHPKTRIYPPNQKKEVTNLVIGNKNIAVSDSYVDKLVREIRQKENTPSSKGKLAYVKSINQKQARSVLRSKGRR